MADHGVLAALRQLLTDAQPIKMKGISDKIYFSVPVADVFPMVLLELEEVWTSMRLNGSETAHTKVKLKASILSKKTTSRESLNVAEDVRQAVDGKTVDLEEGKSATIRLATSIIDLPTMNRPRSVQQFYEVLVRG